jgi:hypothetical protein
MEEKTPKEKPIKDGMFVKDIVSLRLTEGDRDFLNENFELICGDSAVTSPRQFFITAAERAISKTRIIEKPVEKMIEVVKSDPEQEQTITDLRYELRAANELQEQVEARFKDYLIIARRDKIADNYIDLFVAILKAMQNGFLCDGKKFTGWILDENDKKYIAEQEGK